MPNAASACALCLGSGPLCDSHILPEFLFRPTYTDESGEIEGALELRATDLRVRTRYQGYTEKLLCLGCERRINRHETYFANAWFNHQVRPSIVGPGPVMEIAGLDYRRFRLFHHSILWRMGVSRRDEFKAVRLGPHAERLRRWILAEESAPLGRYQVMARALYHPEDRRFADDVVSFPSRGRLDGEHLYGLIFGGCYWIYRVSSHPTDPTTLGFFEDGRLRLGVQSLHDCRAITKLVFAFDGLVPGDTPPSQAN